MSRKRRYFRLRSAGSERGEVNDELAFHLEMKVEQLRQQGLSESEARAEALRQFGDYERIRRETAEEARMRARDWRRADFLDGLRQDLRFAFRQLRAAPAFALVALLTLALGTGATTAIFTVVRATLLRPLPYDEAGRVVVIGEANESSQRTAEATTSFDNYEDWRARARSFAAMALYNGWSPSLTGVGEPERLTAAFVTADFFDVFRVQPILGRPMLPSDNVPNAPIVVWLSHGLWQSRFAGARDVVGRTITLSGVAREIVGVMPAGFEPPGEMAGQLWGNNWKDPADTRTSRYLNVVARLQPTVSLQQAGEEMRRISRELEREYPNDNTGSIALVRPLRDVVIGSTTRQPILLLMLASALVLLIACANVSNLLVARTGYRARELAIRAALGTSRARVVRQLMTESGLLALLGAAGGLLVAAAALRLLIQLAPPGIQQQNVTVDPVVLGFAVLTATLAALLFGVVPALRASRGDLQAVLRDSARGGSSERGRRLRRGLVVIQLSLSLALLLSAGLLIKSFAKVLAVNPGIVPEQVLTMSMALPGAKYPREAVPPFFERLIERQLRVPGVRAAAVTSIVPFGGSWDRIVVDTGGGSGLPMSQWPEGDRYIVSPSYFNTMGVTLLRGRLFTATDRAGQLPVAVVDEVFARKVERGGSPLGVRIGVPGNDSAATIVGVVRHVKHYGLDAESGGQIYVSHVQYPWRWMSLVVKTERDPLQLAAAVRAAVQELDRDQPVYDITTVETLMRERTATRRFVIALLAAFAAIALVLASVGLYGVMAYAVAQRRREFGIRLALGAEPGDLVRGVLREAAALTSVGLLSGAVLAAFGGRLLASLLFQVRAVDPPVALVAIAVLGITAGLASFIPARRAALVDPNIALRAE